MASLPDSIHSRDRVGDDQYVDYVHHNDANAMRMVGRGVEVGVGRRSLESKRNGYGGTTCTTHVKHDSTHTYIYLSIYILMEARI
jgi:hypothetical protein